MKRAILMLMALIVGALSFTNFAHADYVIHAEGPGYNDAGIVMYFNGEFQLGNLSTASYVGTGDPLSWNLWFDKNGNGQFFAFDNNGLMTGLNGDTYALGGSSPSIDSNTLFQMQDGSGLSKTLAELQAGAIPGINATTQVAVWLGLTDPEARTGNPSVNGDPVQPDAFATYNSNGSQVGFTVLSDGIYPGQFGENTAWAYPVVPVPELPMGAFVPILGLVGFSAWFLRRRSTIKI